MRSVVSPQLRLASMRPCNGLRLSSSCSIDAGNGICLFSHLGIRSRDSLCLFDHRSHGRPIELGGIYRSCTLPFCAGSSPRRARGRLECSASTSRTRASRSGNRHASARHS